MKLLVVVGNDPSERHAGELFLEAIVRRGDADVVDRVSVLRAGTWKAVGHWPHGEHFTVRQPRERGVLRWGRLVAWPTNLAAQTVTRWLVRKRLAPKVLDFVRRSEPSRILTFLSSPTAIFLGAALRRCSEVSVIPVVWDPPGRWVAEYDLDPLSERRLRKDFGELIRSSGKCGVGSNEMKEEYEREFGVRAEMLYEGAVAHESLGREMPSRDRLGRVRIAFAGSGYAQGVFKSFLRALDGAGWKVNGRPLEMEVFGNALTSDDIGGRPIVAHEWRPVPETANALAHMDLGYLPYWLEDSMRESARLCFPAKLASYVSAGLPIFFHGPPEASVASFLRRHRVGVICSSTETEEIIRALANAERALIGSHEVPAICRDILKTEFNPDNFSVALRSLLREHITDHAPPSVPAPRLRTKA